VSPRQNMARAGLDERLWQSGDASGLCSPLVRGAFFPSSAALRVAALSSKMSELRRKGVARSDLKIIASDPDLAEITKDVEALNNR
jgi:hypothetical protein